MGGITALQRKEVEMIGIIRGHRVSDQYSRAECHTGSDCLVAFSPGVTSEVRSLAQRSCAAATEVKDLIGESAATVEQGASLVFEAQTTIHEAMSAVERVTGVMKEIEASALEQSDGIEQVTRRCHRSTK